jgi:hypothetical protein
MAFRVSGPTTCGSLICLFRVDRQQYAFGRARPKHDPPFREPPPLSIAGKFEASVTAWCRPKDRSVLA